eukprot:scaffold1339_cov58-Attheya_sp.AAC.4
MRRHARKQGRHETQVHPGSATRHHHSLGQILPLLSVVSRLRERCDRLLALACRAVSAREDAITGPISASKLRAWSCWVQFLDCIELDDNDFLKDFDWGAQQVILGAFAQTVHEAEYSTAAFMQLASATVKATMDYVAQTFDDNFTADPRWNSTGQTSHLLSMQYGGYKNQDPPAVQQKAITCSLLRQVGTTIQAPSKILRQAN